MYIAAETLSYIHVYLRTCARFAGQGPRPIFASNWVHNCLWIGVHFCPAEATSFAVPACDVGTAERSGARQDDRAARVNLASVKRAAGSPSRVLYRGIVVCAVW